MKRLNVDIIFSEDDVEVTYELKKPLTILDVTIPDGFTSDGASNLRVLWSIYPPVGKYLPAAFLHDYLLYRNAHWKTALKYFDKALQECSVSDRTRKLMVMAVKLYGLFKNKQ